MIWSALRPHGEQGEHGGEQHTGPDRAHDPAPGPPGGGTQGGRERTGEHDPFEPQVDHSRALGDGFAGGREDQRGGHPHRGGEEPGNEQLGVHYPATLPGPIRFRTTARKPVQPPRGTVASRATIMTTASTTYTATAGIPASRCMAPAPASRAPKRTPAMITPSGMQATEQGHRDSGKAIPGRQVLKQGIGHPTHFDSAGQPRDRTGKEQGHGPHALAVDPATDLGSTRAHTDHPESEPPQRFCEEKPEDQSAGQGEHQARVQPRTRPQR